MVKLDDGRVPKYTAVAFDRFVPVMTTLLSPVVAPVAGLTSVTAGGGGNVPVISRMRPLPSLPLSTMTRRPADPTLTPDGLLIPAAVARPPSPVSAEAPVPAIV